MKPISINLASRPFYNQTLYLVTFAVSVSLLVVMTALNLYTFYVDQRAWSDFREKRDRLQADLSSLDRQAVSHERALKQLNLVQVTEQSSFANQAILQRVFSWTVLFNRLEEVIPLGVKLLAIRPRVGDDGINFRVTGVAKNGTAFTQFEENLLQSPMFSHVYPISERLSRSGRGLDFALSFRYLSADAAMQPDAAPEPDASADPPGPEGSPQEERQPGATRASGSDAGESAGSEESDLESSS